MSKCFLCNCSVFFRCLVTSRWPAWFQKSSEIALRSKSKDSLQRRHSHCSSPGSRSLPPGSVRASRPVMMVMMMFQVRASRPGSTSGVLGVDCWRSWRPTDGSSLPAVTLHRGEPTALCSSDALLASWRRILRRGRLPASPPLAGTACTWSTCQKGLRAG